MEQWRVRDEGRGYGGGGGKGRVKLLVLKSGDEQERRLPWWLCDGRRNGKSFGKVFCKAVVAGWGNPDCVEWVGVITWLVIGSRCLFVLYLSFCCLRFIGLLSSLSYSFVYLVVIYSYIRLMYFFSFVSLPYLVIYFLILFICLSSYFIYLLTIYSPKHFIDWFTW